jgi:hypothetical protein
MISKLILSILGSLLLAYLCTSYTDWGWPYTLVIVLFYNAVIWGGWKFFGVVIDSDD